MIEHSRPVGVRGGGGGGCSPPDKFDLLSIDNDSEKKKAAKNI